MAFDIKFLADVSDFIKGTDNVGESLEAIGDDLKDVAKVSDKALDSVGKDLQGVTKDAQTMDEKTEQAFKNMGQNAKDTGRKMGQDIQDGTDNAGQGLDELKDEAAGTATEMAASFSSIEDLASGLQEVAANAFVGFGPAGMAAGLVAAAGIGLAISALQENADEINDNKQKMLDLAQVIRDNGGVLNEADYVQQMDDYGYAIQDTKEWFEIFQDDAVSGFDKLKKASDATGLSARDIFKGGFGSISEAKSTLDLVSKKLEQTKDKAEALYNLDGSIDPVNSTAITTLEDYKKQVEQNIRAQEVAAEIERQRKNSIQGTTQALKEDIEALEKRSDVMKGSVTSELDYLDSVDDLAAKLETSNAAWDKNTAAGRDNQRAVIDIANGIEDMAKASIDAGEPVDAVTAKFNAQKDALINQVTPAFGGSKEAARQYIEQILKTPPQTKTTVTLQGEAEVRAKLDGLSAPIGVLLRPEAPTETYFQSVLNQLRGREVPVKLSPTLGQGSGV